MERDWTVIAVYVAVAFGVAAATIALILRVLDSSLDSGDGEGGAEGGGVVTTTTVTTARLLVPLKLRKLVLRNRAIRAAAYSGSGLEVMLKCHLEVAEGPYSLHLLGFDTAFRKLTVNIFFSTPPTSHNTALTGGAGMTTIAYCAVSEDGKTFGSQLVLDTASLTAEQVAGVQRMTAAVHAAGAAVSVQLTHGGGFATAAVIGCQQLAPSATFSPANINFSKAMSEVDLDRIATAFAQAAHIAKVS
jgi:hypothetical protein